MQQCVQFPHKALRHRCTLHLGLGLFRQKAHRFRDVGKAHFFLPNAHFPEVPLRQHPERRRKQNGFLFPHNIPEVGHHFWLKGQKFCLIPLLQQAAALQDFVPDRIVKGPHHGGGTVKSRLFQERKQLVVLPGNVFDIRQQLVVYLQPGVLDELVFLQQGFRLGQYRLQRPVFVQIAFYRVPLRQAVQLPHLQDRFK